MSGQGLTGVPCWSKRATTGRHSTREDYQLFSRRSFVAAGLLAPLARPAAAEARYPGQSLTVVNPFAARGQSDPIGRIVNAHFQNPLGQPFLMENSARAAGTIGGHSAVRWAPGRYSL